INFKEPGENLIANGDFTDGKQDWTWELQGSGQAQWSVDNGEAHIEISNGGGNDYDVQLRQNCIPLNLGNFYVFEFDARADATRLIEAKVGQDNSPYINYSKTTYSQIRPVNSHFSYEFEMEDASDFNARVVFNMGNSETDVYLDNISLKQKVAQWAYKDADNTIPGTIQCEEYDYGGEGMAYHDNTPQEGDRNFRPGENVDVEICEDEDGGYNIGWTEDGEWLEYTVSAESGTYDIECRTTSDFEGGNLKVILDDQTLTSFFMPNTGGWNNWETLVHSGIVIYGGQNLVLRLEIIGGYYNLNWIKFNRTGSGIEAENFQPHDYALYQNNPNPFNPETEISYELAEYSQVRIQIYNVTGKHVKTLVDQKQKPGFHRIQWDGRDKTGCRVESGIYLIRMISGKHRFNRKIMMIK
ncbi:carbohydrate-binding protein, partial [bacterium]|nr:carbohydrate-binding protein [bacterium]